MLDGEADAITRKAIKLPKAGKTVALRALQPSERARMAHDRAAARYLPHPPAPEADGDATRAVRRLLKFALRRFGLKAIEVREEHP